MQIHRKTFSAPCAPRNFAKLIGCRRTWELTWRKSPGSAHCAAMKVKRRSSYFTIVRVFMVKSWNQWRGVDVTSANFVISVQVSSSDITAIFEITTQKNDPMLVPFHIAVQNSKEMAIWKFTRHFTSRNDIHVHNRTVLMWPRTSTC